MDYTEVPRKLIYKDRTDLKDFGVQTQGTINNYLFNQMRRLTLLHCGNAKEIALQCFNNAYYICTLTQLDEFPDLSMDKYEKELLHVKIPFPEDVYQASMALVCVLLTAYDDKYKQNDDPLIESIHHWTSSNKWACNLFHKSFDDIINTCNTDRFIVPPSEFEPRDIIEVIETFSEFELQKYAEYICERLNVLDDPHQRKYGADMAIARIKGYQLELCEDSGYNPKKDFFKYDKEGCYSDSVYEDTVRSNYKRSKEAIEYYTEHYPKEDNSRPKRKTVSAPVIPGNEALAAENEKLKQQLINCNSEIKNQKADVKNLKKQIEELEKRLKEAHTLPETVTAQQKVRMELARKLMEQAGINNEVLEKWGTKDKAGTLMGTLLDIRPSTCKTYLSDPCLNMQYHEKTVKDINNILEILEVDFRL